jgi:undecaprenyl-diphosphatase
MMNFFQAFILGIVEGVTEFLPISSTGHMIVTSKLLGIVQSPFLGTFEIVIQLGAICAVIYIYRHLLLGNIEVLKRVIVAFIPTGIIGLALYKILKTYLLGNTGVVLWSLFLGGVLLIAFEKWYKADMATMQAMEELTYKDAAIIGVFQAFSIIPGVSRSAATAIGGMWRGLSREAVVQFSFLLAIPTMLAASGVDLLKSGFSFSGSEWGMLAFGFVVAFFVAMAAIKTFLSYVQKHTLEIFGYYRIAAAVLFWVILMR